VLRRSEVVIGLTCFEVIALTSNFKSQISNTETRSTDYWIKHNCGCHCECLKCTFCDDLDVLVKNGNIIGIGSRKHEDLIKEIIDVFKVTERLQRKKSNPNIKRLK
jgi:hypothetical protein